MNKLSLTLLGLCLSTLVFAKDSFNKKHQKQKNALQEKNYGVPNFNKGSITLTAVPTLFKSSKWSDFNNVWLGENTQEFIYNNDKLIAIYQFDYTKSDTLGKASFSYNSDNLLSQYLYENYITGTGFVPQNRSTNTYSNSNKTVVSLHENYNSTNSSWEINHRTTTQIVNNGETERTIYEFKVNGNWIMSDINSYTTKRLSTNANKITEYIDSTFNRTTETLELIYMESRIYDSNENIVENTFYENVNGNTIAIEVDSIFYTNNTPSEVLIFEPNPLNNVLDKKFKISDLTWLNYNPNIDLDDNYFTGYIKSEFNNNSWELNEKHYSTILDNYGSIIEMYDLYDGNNWQAYEKYTVLNDDKRKNIEYKYETYDNFANEWLVNYGSRAQYIYDNNGNISETEQSSYDLAVEQWKKTYKYEYANYININTGFNSYKNTIEAKLYPNPSTNGTVYVNVNLEAASTLNIKITDMKGSVVYTDESNVGKGLNTIELKNLQRGLYIVELTTDYGVARQKLAIK